MELRILSPNYTAIDTIDVFDSFIWTERYQGVGDFELQTQVSAKYISLMGLGNMISIKDSDRTMIIETVQVKTDATLGDKLVVTGRSLESILDRRIVLRQIQLDGTLQDGIQALLTENAINGVYPTRNFPGFLFYPTTDPNVTSLNLTAQYYSENLLEVIVSLVNQTEIGFRMLWNFEYSLLQASLYSGADRSYDQTANPYVIFSPEFDNLVSSEFYTTSRYKKTYVLVSGDPTGIAGLPQRVQVWNPPMGTSGYDRYEMFEDARDLPRYNEVSGEEIDSTTYGEQLTQRGEMVLSKNQILSYFDGKISLVNSYKYNTDFFLGDIVQIKDKYGNTGKARITEMTISYSLDDISVYPTLKNIP